jgi:hypothetical protein
LTPAGLDRLRRASRTHLRGIDEHFLAALEPDDLPAIRRSMRSVAERAGPAETTLDRSPVVDRAAVDING